ncbi:MAG: hypothetical protein ABR586_09690 [Thermoplasmatota archaeon]
MVPGDYTQHTSIRSNARHLNPATYVMLSITLAAWSIALGMTWNAFLVVQVASLYIVTAGLRLFQQQLNA